MQYDFIIAGAGLAGLSLSLALLESEKFREAQILLLDKDAKKSNDRTWSFWSKDLGALADIAVGNWSHVKVIGANHQPLDIQLAPYQYYTIRGLDFYQYAFQKIDVAPNITFRQEEIKACYPDGSVECKGETFTGNQIFKSYFLPSDISIDPSDAFVWQHFKGWEIKTQKDCFDPSEATLMDFRVADGTLTEFFYVLPFAKNRALIEYTAFSKDILQQHTYDNYLKKYIAQQLGIEDYEIVEKEFNAIPMTDHDFRPNLNGKIQTIGTMAGYVKPSSGYCFTRTLERTQKLVQMLETGREVEQRQLESSARYQLYDAALLHIISHQIIAGDRIFFSLFNHFQNDLVFKFLDEKTSFLEDIKIMSVVPRKDKFAQFLFKKSWNYIFSRFKRLISFN